MKLAPYTPEFAIPLAYDETTLSDLLAEKIKEGEFYVNKNGYYELAYSGITDSRRLDEVLFFQSLSLPTFTINTLGNANFDVTNSVAFPGPNGEELTYIVTKPTDPSKVSFLVTNNYNQGANISITLVDANKVGSTQPVTGSVSMVSGVSANLELDLTNSQFRFESGANPNAFKVKVQVAFANGGPTSGSLSIKPTINALKFHYIEGWLGNFDFLFATSNDIDIKLFNTRYGDFKDGVQFYDPQLRVNLSNSTGFDCQVTTDEIYTTEANSTVKNYLHLVDGVTNYVQTKNLAGATKVANPPYVTPSSIAPSFYKDSITRNTSDVGKAFVIFGNLPNKLHYQVRIKSNQTRVGTNRNFFAFDSSKVRVAYNAILPLDGRIYRYTALDTFKVDLPTSENSGTGKLDYAELAVKIENGFPCTLYGQLYFANENKVIFDSLIESPPFSPQTKLMDPAAVTGAPDFRVTSPNIGPIKKFKLTAEKYRIIQDKARYMMYMARVVGPKGTVAEDPNNYAAAGYPDPQKRIRIYPDYNIKSQLGVSFIFKTAL